MNERDGGHDWVEGVSHIIFIQASRFCIWHQSSPVVVCLNLTTHHCCLVLYQNTAELVHWDMSDWNAKQKVQALASMAYEAKWKQQIYMHSVPWNHIERGHSIKIQTGPDRKKLLKGSFRTGVFHDYWYQGKKKTCLLNPLVYFSNNISYYKYSIIFKDF